MKMGEVLDFDKEDMDELSYAAVLHDIGKIAIPDAILGKPAKLTEEEFEIMKTHTTKGYEILKSADQYTDLAKYALTHHEKFDGTGYPNGTKGEDIPLISRIIAIADAYEAMTADRPYRKAQPLSFALDQLNKYKGKQFDPKLVDLFVDKVIPFDQENITSNRHI
jgi:HD-GYP domain-containing protein (c-di-GMP phosphodiesterase class II)